MSVSFEIKGDQPPPVHVNSFRPISPLGAAEPATYEVVAVDNKDEDEDRGDDGATMKPPAIQMVLQQGVQPPSRQYGA